MTSSFSVESGMLSVVSRKYPFPLVVFESPSVRIDPISAYKHHVTATRFMINKFDTYRRVAVQRLQAAVHAKMKAPYFRFLSIGMIKTYTER